MYQKVQTLKAISGHAEIVRLGIARQERAAPQRVADALRPSRRYRGSGQPTTPSSASSSRLASTLSPSKVVVKLSIDLDQAAAQDALRTCSRSCARQ